MCEEEARVVQIHPVDNAAPALSGLVTTFVGRRADGRLNTRNRIVCAYRQQTSAVGPTAFNTSRPDSKNESCRLMLR